MTCARRNDPDHSRLLLWHSAGSLGQDETRSVEAHLAGCATCREEIDPLRSVGESLRNRSASAIDPHPEIDLLLAYEGSTSSQDPRLRKSIETHLDQCASCRDEIEALRRARRRFPPPVVESGEALRAPSRARVLRGRIWAGVGVAAAIAAVALVVPLLRTRGPALPEATLTPGERGSDKTPVLTGNGPWSLEVELPFESPAGKYSVSLFAGGGSDAPSPGDALPAVSSRSGRIRFVLPALPPGRYEVRVKHADPGERMEHAYPFRVIAASARETTPRSPP